MQVHEGESQPTRGKAFASEEGVAGGRSADAEFHRRERESVVAAAAAKLGRSKRAAPSPCRR